MSTFLPRRTCRRWLDRIDGSSATYDAENHLVQYVEPPSLGGLSETYEYDGLGRRVAKLVLGATVAYVYDGLGHLAAEYTDLPSILAPCQTPCYPAHDYLGSVRLVTDYFGNISGRHDYLPFGEEIQATDPGRTSQWGPGNDENVPTKFTGQLRDGEIGLDDFGARRYGFALGRFTSADPAGIFVADLSNPQSWNLYSYGWNSPLVNVDPTGTSCVTTNNGPADDGDGKGCADAGVKAGDPNNFQHPVTNQGQINANVYGSANAASLEMRDALAAFTGSGVKNLDYLPSDPFTQDFQKSLGMAAINEAMKASCQAGNPKGNTGVGTGEAFVNTMLDQVLPNGFQSVSEAQIGAFNAGFNIRGDSASVTVTNPISLNSLLLHVFSGGAALLSGVGQSDAGSYFGQLGQKSGNGRFGTVHQTLHILAKNPCR